MFDHQDFKLIQFDEIPLDQDLFVRDVVCMPGYEGEWIKCFNGEDGDPYGMGYVSYVAARSIGNDWVELSWYPNINDRFHEVPVFLPKSAFVACVEVWKFDGKPTIFVKSEWLTELYERPLTAFAVIDGIGIKDLLRTGKLQSQLLRNLRDRIDEIADRHPDFAFISFADSLMVKQLWSVGHVHSTIKYTYSPETLFPVVSELMSVFEETLGVSAYAIMTQGLNAYADDTNLHRSVNGNHVSLNALGLPFAQLMAIDEAARMAIKSNTHDPAELYLDSMFFRSLKMKSEFDKNQLGTHVYRSPMTKSDAKYVATSVKEVMDNIE
ncbi:MAG: hypothetical protein KGK17_06070 [Betaproteobacteria bacterium]|nr:hypothetical protein [Betaproteobacteria bacterium]